MTREEATNCLADLLDAYNADWHGDYFYDNSDAVCDAVVFFMENRPRWISVEERLPEPDTDVLTRRSIGTMDVEVYHEDEVSWTWDGYSKGFVTHWMPLPEPPEVEV